MLENLLFETRIGEWLLAQFERRTGLAIVRAESLGNQEIRPTATGQNGTQKHSPGKLEALWEGSQQ